MPKFFIPLGFRYGVDGGDEYYHLGSVYGPYENGKAVAAALARLWPNEKKEQFLVFEGFVLKVKPSAKEKPEAEKRMPGNLENYVKDGEGYKCKDCGGRVLGAKVAHPVHLREMPGTGHGECQYETVPYCPNCEKTPDFNGVPVLV